MKSLHKKYFLIFWSGIVQNTEDWRIFNLAGWEMAEIGGIPKKRQNFFAILAGRNWDIAISQSSERPKILNYPNSLIDGEIFYSEIFSVVLQKRKNTPFLLRNGPFFCMKMNFAARLALLFFSRLIVRLTTQLGSGMRSIRLSFSNLP